MGVQGLWQLLEPAGKPVDPSTLNGKVLAVDASIWLHQLMKGFRDKDGNPLPNAHLLGVFYRVCKLLGYGIKPVFVFDGGVPILKRQTLAARRQKKIEALDKSEAARQKLLSNFLKQQLQRRTGQVLPSELGENEDEGSPLSSPKKKVIGGSPTKRNRFQQEIDEELLQFREKFAAKVEPDVDRVDKNNRGEKADSSSDEEDGRWRYGMDYSENFSAITSKDFDTLPLETQHEILFEMQESRKMNSWGRMDQMPQNLKDFSSYQMDRLVKRRFLQKKIQSVQQEMGQRHIHVQNLDELLKMNYDFGEEDELKGSQDKGYVFVKKKDKVPEKLDDGIKEETQSQEFSTKVPSEECELLILSDSDSSSVSEDIAEKRPVVKSIPEMEEDEQLALAIQLSLEDVSSKSAQPTCSFTTIHQTQPGSSSKAASSRFQKPQEIIPSSLPSSCSKFLDTVGFSSRAQESAIVGKRKVISEEPISLTSKTGKSESSSDTEEDDFEAVELSPPSLLVSTTVTQKPTSDERKMVEALLCEKLALVNDDAVATINIADVVAANPEEEDLFADIFDNDSSSKSDVFPKIVPKKNGGDNVTIPAVEESPKPVASISPAKHSKDPPSSSESEVEEIQDLGPLSPPSSLGNTVAGADAGSTRNITPANPAVVERTLGKIPDQGTSKVRIITAEYMQEQARLNAEHAQLLSEKGFQERVATSLSEQMNVETQELLSLFGIPYVISPMEAESQCAFLDVACLTDGTITDDSDCWLFGSLRAYKNFYSSGTKQIEFYQLADITKNLNLDRDKLILIALLSGGDYSDGIDGVGPVTALEILSEFSHESLTTDAFDVLLKFREWWDLINEPAVEVPDLPKTRQKLKKLKLSPGFPNRAIYDAYMNPTIDTSTEPFRWRSPDIDAIRAYTDKKFGWDSRKCDAMVLPVLKRLECQIDKSKQLTLDTFLVSRRFDLESQHSSKRKKGSKRLLAAFEKLKGQAPEEVALSESDEYDEDEANLPPPRKQKKTAPTKSSTTNQSKTTKKNSTKHDAGPSKSTRRTSTNDNDAGPSKSLLEEINRSFHNRNNSIPQATRTEAKKAENKRKAIELIKRKSKKYESSEYL